MKITIETLVRADLNKVWDVWSKTMEHRMSDGREVSVEFFEVADGVLVKEEFDAETGNPAETRRAGDRASVIC